MRFGLKSILAIAAALVLPQAARAQLVETTIPVQGDSSNWSATAGRTVGANNTVIQAEAGWPGIGVTYLKGQDAVSDLGFRARFNYGLEGTTNTTAGLNLAVPYRRTIYASGNTALAFEAAPGIDVYGNNGGVLFGIALPIGAVAGFKVDPKITLDVGADVPMLISFSNPAGFLIGPRIGGGGEYQIDRNLAVTARIRIGPEFAANSAGTGRQTAFETLIGLAYNVR